MKNFFYYWLPVYIYAGLIFYLSSLPAIPPPITGIISQTLILHIIEYAILSILLFRALINSNNFTLRNNVTLLVITITTFYGITDEIHQLFVPGRVFSHLDIIANFIGSTFILTKNIIPKNKLDIKRRLKTCFSR